MRKDFTRFLDLSTKVVAVVTAYSMLMSVLYFEIVFQRVAGNWIGSLTLEDYVAGALDLLPATLALAFLFISVLALAFWLMTHGLFRLTKRVFGSAPTSSPYLADRLLLGLVGVDANEMSLSVVKTGGLGTVVLSIPFVFFSLFLALSKLKKYYPVAPSLDQFVTLRIIGVSVVFIAIYYVCCDIKSEKKLSAFLIALGLFSSLTVVDKAEIVGSGKPELMQFSTCGATFSGSPILYLSRGVLINDTKGAVRMVPWEAIKSISNSAIDSREPFKCEHG
jgi:hypothetical protein